jgi:hypothetical protein
VEPSAKVIADSVSPEGIRLTTMEVCLHRFTLAELNTHRVFSRNSASSRAIPLKKQLDRVWEEPAVPVTWPAEQPGMQGGADIEDITSAENVWLRARVSAHNEAQALGRLGVHKSIANRLLEPFMWHTVIVTSTAWKNFFGLRCNPMAQPEIRAAAELMEKAFADSQPRDISDGMWHLPYIYPEDWQENPDFTEAESYAHLVKVSAARCARVSYLTHDGRPSHEADLNLYDRLVSADPMHASPLEHVATPNGRNMHWVDMHSRFDGDRHAAIRLPKYGNLLGWHQHRFDVEVARGYQAFA